MSVASLDFETRSVVDLKKTGVHRYAEHETTDVWCMAWRIGDGQVQVWQPGEAFPAQLAEWVAAGRPVVIHNAQFDRTIWNVVLRRHVPHLPPLAIEQTSCTMARAQAMALPASLDMLGSALGIRLQKDREGAALMMRMCRPRSVDPVTWWDDAERRARLAAYCQRDVEAEREVGAALPNLDAREQRVYHLDQNINDRGFAIDVPLVRRAALAVSEAKTQADRKMWLLTDGEVKKCSETAKLVQWINSKGVPCESVAKGEQEELLLASDVIGDATVREVIELRRAAGKTSTAKYEAMLNAVCQDGRLRGTLAYHGASTGRWAGRLVQPQNFPRVDPDRDLPNVEAALDILQDFKSGVDIVGALEMLVGDPLVVLSKSLRAMIVAGEGKALVGGDFSNIEGRVNAWLAGEHWKLDAFREYDAGTGPDLYYVTAAEVTGKPLADLTKYDRQISGKVPELACGFQGSVGAFSTWAQSFGVRMEEDRMLEIVRKWRAKNSKIVQSWWDLQDAALAAVGRPGEKVYVLDGRVVYLAHAGWLFCRLPSGRALAYCNPRVVEVEDPQGRKRFQVEYNAVNSMTKKWGPERLYGGLQCENIVQAVARDIMVEAMFRVEDAGAPLILTVHDELVSEVDEASTFDDKELKRLMSILPGWADGLPIAAEAWRDKRYVK